MQFAFRRIWGLSLLGQHGRSCYCYATYRTLAHRRASTKFGPPAYGAFKQMAILRPFSGCLGVEGWWSHSPSTLLHASGAMQRRVVCKIWKCWPNSPHNLRSIEFPSTFVMKRNAQMMQVHTVNKRPICIIQGIHGTMCFGAISTLILVETWCTWQNFTLLAEKYYYPVMKKCNKSTWVTWKRGKQGVPVEGSGMLKRQMLGIFVLYRKVTWISYNQNCHKLLQNWSIYKEGRTTHTLGKQLDLILINLPAEHFITATVNFFSCHHPVQHATEEKSRVTSDCSCSDLFVPTVRITQEFCIQIHSAILRPLG